LEFVICSLVLYNKAMLYLLHGQNFKKSREKLHSMTDSLLKKKPDASFFKLDSSNFVESQLDELVGGQGLFEQKYIVQMDGLLENTATRDFVIDRVDSIAESENIFLIIEENITKPILKRLEKQAEKIQEFVLSENGGRKFAVIGGGELNLSEFNIFDLADAFGRRDKKEFWVLYQKAKMRDIPDEEIHGIINWQLKSILIAQKSKNVEDSGLKPFVYNKSLRFAKNFEEGELEKLSSKIVSIYHDARRGLCDFSVEMEKFVLGV
jgi:DNA polymerase III delta subunit